MQCTNPLVALKSFDKEGNATIRIVPRVMDRISMSYESRDSKKIYLPCGKCINCRVNKANQKAIRCVHESLYHKATCFITLTYAPEFLPPGGSLRVEDFQDFMKRFRSYLKYHFPGNPHIKCVYCGEYGDKNSRPHFHALIFGFDFTTLPDSRIVKYDFKFNYHLYASPTLEDLWRFGIVRVGALNFMSSAYVCRYVTKKIYGDLAESHYNGKRPEFCNFSNGIGKQFAIDNAESLLANGCIVRPGKSSIALPRYYVDKIIQNYSTDPRFVPFISSFYEKKEFHADHASGNHFLAPHQYNWESLDNLDESSFIKFSTYIRSYESEDLDL